MLHFFPLHDRLTGDNLPVSDWSSRLPGDRLFFGNEGETGMTRYPAGLSDEEMGVFRMIETALGEAKRVSPSRPEVIRGLELALDAYTRTEEGITPQNLNASNDG